MTNTYDIENRRTLTSESSGWHASRGGGLRDYESALQEEGFNSGKEGREVDGGVKKCKVTIRRVLFRKSFLL